MITVGGEALHLSGIIITAITVAWSLAALLLD
jgi:hypothetical protein